MQAAVELLVAAGQPNAAFAAAVAHSAMAAFARALGATGAPTDYERAAAALLSTGQWAAAGDVRRRRGLCAEAVALYIKVRMSASSMRVIKHALNSMLKCASSIEW